jgi:hypothetical protein
MHVRRGLATPPTFNQFMNTRIAKKIVKNLENPKLNMRGEPKLKHNKNQIAKAKRIVRLK